MERRLFFRALLGAPAIAAAAPAKPRPVMARVEIPSCECGFMFRVNRAFLEGVPSDRGGLVEFMTCENAHCRHYGKELAIPRVALQTADPHLVAKVKEEIARQEELERRAKAEMGARDRAAAERYGPGRIQTGLQFPTRPVNPYGLSFPVMREMLDDDRYHLLALDKSNLGRNWGSLP